jgi:hypothetical protein
MELPTGLLRETRMVLPTVLQWALPRAMQSGWLMERPTGLRLVSQRVAQLG